MKLRLFALRDKTTNKLVPNLHFSSKPEAKKERDKLNGGKPDGPYVVTNGPDHRRFKL